MGEGGGYYTLGIQNKKRTKRGNDKSKGRKQFREVEIYKWYLREGKEREGKGRKGKEREGKG